MATRQPTQFPMNPAPCPAGCLPRTSCASSGDSQLERDHDHTNHDQRARQKQAALTCPELPRSQVAHSLQHQGNDHPQPPVRVVSNVKNRERVTSKQKTAAKTRSRVRRLRATRGKNKERDLQRRPDVESPELPDFYRGLKNEARTECAPP